LIEVGRLQPDRWEEYKRLRMEALESDPAAFSSSEEDETPLSEVEWRRRTGNVLFAFSEGRPVGMIGFLISSRAKTKHTADIFSVYVRVSERGKGVGRILLESALSEITKNQHVSKIKLTVNPEQQAAVRLYRKAGFQEVGRLHRELKIGDGYYDELIMEKQI
jgi:ribosomal protein S18 acetylase RimI-like enzyme